MYKKRFGKLLAALRREHWEDGKPWSRARFAEISGIEEDILANIENGRKAILLPDLLTRLANALKLTSGERREFFLAASGVDEQALYRNRDTPQAALTEALGVMERLQQPAFLTDQYLDIIAANSMVLDLYKVTPAHFFESKSDPATRFNLMRFLFDPAFEAQISMFGEQQHKLLIYAVMRFRALSLRYRATPYFKYLYAGLNRLEDFRKFNLKTLENEREADNSISMVIRHPQYGALKSVNASIVAASSAGELTLTLLAPLDKFTAGAYAKLAAHGYIVHLIKDWPQKNVPAETYEKPAR